MLHLKLLLRWGLHAHICLRAFRFARVPALLAGKENRKGIQLYNRLAKALLEFEGLWLRAWRKGLDFALQGLNAPLIIRNPDSGMAPSAAAFVDSHSAWLLHSHACCFFLGVQHPGLRSHAACVCIV